MKYREFTCGHHYRILTSRDVEHFLTGPTVSKKDRSSINRTLQRLADTGQVRNEQKFRKERGEIFAVKSGSVRIYGWFAAGKLFVGGCGVLKKSQKADPAALDRAARLYSEFQRGDFEVEKKQDSPSRME